MTRLQSFAPISAPDATQLILGSMPGKRSLDAQQYYAHPQNAFWRIMGSIFGFDPGSAYTDRCRALTHARIALWDVLGECERPGSLDADIVEASIQPNDFGAFFALHPQINAILLNGAKAEQSYIRYVIPHLDPAQQKIERIRVPSTSPAHAGMRFEDKLKAWRQALTRAV